jgi:uncharacterized repeat protein (TIGR03803 family)
MSHHNISHKLTLTLSLLAACAFFMATSAATQAGAQTETIVHTFSGQPDGQGPFDSLIVDASGNLYGTASGGGSHGGGIVFELTPNGAGGWTETTLYNFSSSPVGAAYEPWAGLVFDSAGNLYGTTYYGGTYGYGTVFELRQVGRQWNEKVLHSFNSNGKDGTYPRSNLTFDSAGNLYGTTPTGGSSGGGTVFQLVPKTGGGWSERVICSFNLKGDVNPNATPVVFDSSGNLYGAVDVGGTSSDGFIYELAPQSNGDWKEETLFNFDYNNGASPTSNLLIDSSGNLYGTALEGGTGSDGIVFELSRGKKGVWTQTILTDFSINATPDIGYPVGNIVFDSAGNLYGSTDEGGPNNDGTVF